MADKISITICGDGGCGKSSITIRLVRSQWTHEYDPTIGMIRVAESRSLIHHMHDVLIRVYGVEDSYSVTRTVDGLPYFISITDTAGQEEYRGLWTSSSLQSDAFLLVYDITNPTTLNSLDHFIDLISLEADQRLEDNERLRKDLGDQAGPGLGLPPPVMIVAGNKCDLKDGRAVSSREGLEYARKHGCGFMETSAREMVNIEETFAHLVRRVVETRRVHQGIAPPRATQSVHTTALPQIKSVKSVKSNSVNYERNYFGFGKRRSRPSADPTARESESDSETGCLLRWLCCG